MQDNNITDVEFKEVIKETEIAKFDPVQYLIDALTANNHPNPSEWTIGLDDKAYTELDEKIRIFFVNRAIRLYMSEHIDQENITPRLLVADGIDKAKWTALVDQGIAPWLCGKFNEKGKRISADSTTDITVTESVSGHDHCTAPGGPKIDRDLANEPMVNTDSANTYEKGDGGDTHIWGDVHPDDMPVIMGVDSAAEGTTDFSSEPSYKTNN